jgi:hypothetical protein
MTEWLQHKKDNGLLAYAKHESYPLTNEEIENVSTCSYKACGGRVQNSCRLPAIASSFSTFAGDFVIE